MKYLVISILFSAIMFSNDLEKYHQIEINGSQNGLTYDNLYDQFVGATLVMNDFILDAGQARLPTGDIDKTTIWWE